MLHFFYHGNQFPNLLTTKPKKVEQSRLYAFHITSTSPFGDSEMQMAIFFTTLAFSLSKYLTSHSAEEQNPSRWGLETVSK